MQLTINHQTYEISSLADEPLIWVLRDELGLTGTKFGCGAGICGACVVHLDGVPIRSCITPVGAAQGRMLTTIEGLATIDDSGSEILHPVQQAFVDQQVPQCGWCMSGQMMTAAAFLARNPRPSIAEIVTAMSANYCRCGCYVRIQAAVALAAQQLQKEST
jgi:isoquinoline 1-oxidoreductase alpha subunit